jgi:hypothetical protein
MRASPWVAQVERSMSSVSSEAKKLSTGALKLLRSSSGQFPRGRRVAVRLEVGLDLPGDVALEAADDLGLRLAVGRPAGDVVDCRLVKAQPHDDGPVESRVGLTMTAGATNAAITAMPDIASSMEPIAAAGRLRTGSSALFGGWEAYRATGPFASRNRCPSVRSLAAQREAVTRAAHTPGRRGRAEPMARPTRRRGSTLVPHPETSQPKLGGTIGMDRRRWFYVAALLGFLLLLSIPLFFGIYREAAFNTAPRDDYSPFLQSVLGQGGKVPGAPVIYRVLSVVAAVPFYFLLPLYAFSNLPNVDVNYLRATEALAAVSWLSLLATAGVIFLICQKKLAASTKASLIVALLSLFFANFLQQTTVDPIALLIISLLLYLIDRPLLFSALMLLSVGFNEKIALLFVMIFGVRLIVERDRSALPLAGVSAVAAAGYFAIRLIVAAPGNENQLMPSTYWDSFVTMLPFLFSLKGAVTNVLPTVLIGLSALLAFQTVSRLHVDTARFHKSDVLIFVGMFLLEMLINPPGGHGADNSFGRIVMYTYPLYVPMLSLRIDEWFPDRQRPVGLDV